MIREFRGHLTGPQIPSLSEVSSRLKIPLKGESCGSGTVMLKINDVIKGQRNIFRQLLHNFLKNFSVPTRCETSFRNSLDYWCFQNETRNPNFKAFLFCPLQNKIVNSYRKIKHSEQIRNVSKDSSVSIYCKYHQQRRFDAWHRWGQNVELCEIKRVNGSEFHQNV